ncbi:Nuclear cap-binding protein subunit 1 [Halotydeus destructor]|nr:Nuclear cap-binding protein subunit 1 [Halotydeus destructor]
MNKRRFNDGDNNRGGWQRNKRPRYSEPELTPEEKLEHDIVYLGEVEESAEMVESSIDEISHRIDEMVVDNKQLILQTVCECIAELPEKTGIYSTLVGLINAKNFGFSGEIVESLVKNFKDYMKAYEWVKARSLVRFFADLANCHVITAGSLLNLFESLVEVTMEDNIPQVRSDYYIFSVLSALPWVGKELSEKKASELDQLLSTIENYITNRTKLHHVGLRVWYTNTPHPQEEYLDCLWTQIQKLRSDSWIERQIVRPYAKFEMILKESMEHNLPQITIPAHDPSVVYPYPRVVFRFFDYTDCPDGPVLPGPHSIERFIIEDSLRETICQRYYDRKDCAKALVKYPGRNKLPIDYMMIEVIFGEMFRLPATQYIDVFYGSLFLELCKLQPSTLPQVLAQSVELMFERLENMNGACVDRFASWFAYHLGNFEFRWAWDDWSSALTLDPLHPKTKFVRETLISCMRLSYHERINSSVPESFHALMPEKPEAKNIYESPTDLVSESDIELAKKIKEMIITKVSPDEILEHLTTQPSDAMEDNVSVMTQTNVFGTVLLNAAKVSFTHLFAAIGKFQKIFKALCSTQEGQLQLLHTIHQVWKNHQQLIVVLIDKLVKAEILESGNVVNWVFSSAMAPEITNNYVWEVLFAVLNRKVRTINQLQEEVEKEREKLVKFEGGDAGDVVLDDENELPSEAKVDRMEETIETQQSELKNLFLVVFQRLVTLLSDHIQNCTSQAKSFRNFWFRWTVGRMQQLLFEYNNNVFNILPSLESMIFTPDIDKNIMLIFQQFRSLRA